MRWPDERYVRVYTRNTGEWILLGWEAQALLVLALRQCDRAGFLKTGANHARGLAAMVGMPLEVVTRCLPLLLEGDGPPMVIRGDSLVVRNFLEAQEAAQSDAQRARECRGRDRDKKLAGVTNCDGSVTKRDETVTVGHGPSQPVTTCHSVPSRTDPSQAVLESDARARVAESVPPNEPGKPSPRFVVTRYLAIRAEVVVGSVAGAKGLFQPPSPSDVEKAAAWISTMTPEECADIEPAIHLACQHVRDGAAGWAKPEMAKAGFLFGSIVRSWPDLREEIHGCAPKVASPAQPKQSGPKPVIWRTS